MKLPVSVRQRCAVAPISAVSAPKPLCGKTPCAHIAGSIARASCQLLHQQCHLKKLQMAQVHPPQLPQGSCQLLYSHPQKIGHKKILQLHVPCLTQALLPWQSSWHLNKHNCCVNYQRMQFVRAKCLSALFMTL